MDAEERIGHMLNDGLITPQQAGKLHASVRVGSRIRSQKRRRGVRHVLSVTAVVAAVIIALLLVLFGEPPAPELSNTQAQQVQDVSQSLNQAGEIGLMNKTVMNSIAIVIILLIPILLLAGIYNRLVNREEAVFKSWAQVESQFQRRADLVPQLIETVKGYALHESQTLSEVTTARSHAMAMLAQAVDKLAENQESIGRMLQDDNALLENQAQMDRLLSLNLTLGKNLSGFIALAEDYPDLRASDQFLELQAQLEGTENRINIARMRFNEAVSQFNAAIRRLPGNLVAGLGRFQRKAYFQAEEQSERAPKVEFH